MSNNKRKQLLSEGEVRKFMKFANIGLDVSDQFLSENYGEELEEGDPARKEKKKPDYKDQMNKEIGDVDKNLKKMVMKWTWAARKTCPRWKTNYPSLIWAPRLLK